MRAPWIPAAQPRAARAPRPGARRGAPRGRARRPHAAREPDPAARPRTSDSHRCRSMSAATMTRARHARHGARHAREDQRSATLRRRSPISSARSRSCAPSSSSRATSRPRPGPRQGALDPRARARACRDRGSAGPVRDCQWPVDARARGGRGVVCKNRLRITLDNPPRNWHSRDRASFATRSPSGTR